MKENIMICSLHRRSNQTPWSVGINHDDRYFSLTIGGKRGITIGPKFQVFLSDVEKMVRRYPVQVSFLHLAENREAEAVMIQNQVAYIDGGFNLGRIIPKARYLYDEVAKESPIAAKQLGENVLARKTTSDNMPQDLDYIMIAELTEVTDGDTITVTPTKHMGDVISTYFGTKDEIKIRYVGVDAMESTPKEGDLQAEYKKADNALTAKKFGITVEDAFEIGDEAAAYNKKLLGWTKDGKQYVVLNFDRQTNGSAPLKSNDSSGNRYMAVVYATSGKNPESIWKSVKAGNSYVNVNKSLLIKNSEKHPKIPLGIYHLKYSTESTSVLETMSWKQELNLDVFDIGAETYMPGTDTEDSVELPEAESEIYETTVNTDTINFANNTGPKSNSHDFFTGLDDRLGDFTAGIEEPEDLVRHSKVRIGDVILTIPPTSIEVSKTMNISRTKTLRTKASTKVSDGQSLTVLTMDLYFHDLENINGRKIPYKEGSKKSFYVDGLRPLLAQFAKAPFLPIDNYYINRSLGISDVALLDIEVATVPNFPESLTARIKLLEFNSQAYTMTETCLYESVNYPMLRWYYNQSLIDRDDYKYRHFKKIDGYITNDTKFTIANEQYLEERKNAIAWIRKAESPEQLRVNLREKNQTYIDNKADSDNIAIALDQYRLYKTLDIEKHSVIAKSPTGTTRKRLQDKYGISEAEAENSTDKGKEWYEDLYGAYSFNTLIDFNYAFLPYESSVYFKMRFDLKWDLETTIPVDYEDEEYRGLEKYGVFLIKKKFSSEDNAKLMEDNFKKYYFKNRGRYYIPATKGNLEILMQIERTTKDMEETIDDYEVEFNKMLGLVDASEKETDMDEFKMSGVVIPISVSASFSNEFSKIPVQKASAPALQFMGGSDTQLSMIFEVDEEGAKSMNDLVEKSNYLARLYRDGITNGFVGIENDMANLFGVQYIMFESITINTVPGFPGRFQVYLQAVGFDKTQRQNEELTALPGNSQNMDLNDLLPYKNAYANDRMIEARLKKLDVYPDLELPTYKELNKALPEMNAGITEYKNLTGGTYVDPDFYFSTKTTFRQYIEDTYDGNHTLNMHDQTGVSVYTSNQDTENVFSTTKDDEKLLEDMQNTDGVEPIDWVFSWANKDDDSSESSGENYMDGAEVAGADPLKINVENQAIKDFFTKTDAEGVLECTKWPTKEEWKRLYGNTDTYDWRSKRHNGTEWGVYKVISDSVDKYFKEFYVEKDLIKALKGDLTDNQNMAKKVSYALPSHLYQVSINEWESIKSIEWGYIKAMRKAKKEKHIEVPKIDKESTVSIHDFRCCSKRPPKERIMAYMKAFLDKMSAWQQYEGDTPKVSGGRIGMAMVDISKMEDLDEVKRLTYDWKYNIDTAIKQLAEHYKKANTLNDNCKNFEVFCRPWDAMFALYEKPGEKIVRSKDVLASSYASGVMKRFEKYAFKPYDTISGFNEQVYRWIFGKSFDVVESEDTKTLIESLLELEYYEVNVLEKAGLSPKDKWKDQKPVMKKHLKKLSAAQLQDLLTAHIGFLNGINDNWIDGEKDENGKKYSGDIIKKAKEMYGDVNSIVESAQNSALPNDTRLYNDVDPQTIYNEMFYDMRHNDQRGRMIRAFPAFQMFIIHEGDYFGKYKFWDNMYGFNAIESIDVYRSRKIAADTACITMTNVYSNLTTRRTDVDYNDRQLKWWDNYLWNEIPQDLIDKKENEVHKNIYLEPGARIHLRMGYSGNASDLPVVFNGTITEMNIGDVIDVVAQGDGLELGSVISGSPDDDNNGLFAVTEPRDLICQFLSSKGSWIKDYLNGKSEGRLFKNNPLGIMHFGSAWNAEEGDSAKPNGNLWWFNDEYGECAQNIYSSNGTPTYSQWMHPNGERNNILTDFSWSTLTNNTTNIFNPGDEDNVVVNFYNQTVWDVVQTVAYATPDYIAAVVPFERRSTLFFGKPYWRCVFEYNSHFDFDPNKKTWVRYFDSENRRPFMQHKLYVSGLDIIRNDICATEDNLFTNVIVNYDGHQTPVLYADCDIRYDKHKTRVVDANIVATFNDYYTSEVMASYYGCSVLRDTMKDMYQGSLLVIGDPTVKPHDLMYIGDDVNDLNGSCQVKAVTHHFSLETGFVSSIEPDLYVVNDDQVMFNLSEWQSAWGAQAMAASITYLTANYAQYRMKKWMMNPDKLPQKVTKWTQTRGVLDALKLADDGSTDMKKIINEMEKIINMKDVDKADAARKELVKNIEETWKSIKIEDADNKTTKFKKQKNKTTLRAAGKVLDTVRDSSKLAKGAKMVGTLGQTVTKFNPISAVISTAAWIGTSMLFEKYRRYADHLQCVVCMPLNYKGTPLTAGINGHGGMVYGDSPGRYKSLVSAQFGKDDGEEIEGIFGNGVFEAISFFAGTEGMYTDETKSKQLNDLSGIQAELDEMKEILSRYAE